jgi:hypothetical protein
VDQAAGHLPQPCASRKKRSKGWIHCTAPATRAAERSSELEPMPYKASPDGCMESVLPFTNQAWCIRRRSWNQVRACFRLRSTKALLPGSSSPMPTTSCCQCGRHAWVSGAPHWQCISKQLIISRVWQCHHHEQGMCKHTLMLNMRRHRQDAPGGGSRSYAAQLHDSSDCCDCGQSCQGEATAPVHSVCGTGARQLRAPPVPRHAHGYL